LDKNFESKSIKERDKISILTNLKLPKKQISYQTTNYLTVPTFPNLYITRKLNNMDEARMIKDKRNNWTKIYHKMLKGLKAMIDVQRQIKDMVKITAETNMTITEIKDSILKASINN